MPTAQVNGATLWFQEVGAGPAIVLVHGFPLDHRIWAAQLADLSSVCRVIVPDLRGFGRSRCDDDFTIESLADDLHALLIHLQALPAVFCGLSMGGYVCLAHAKKYPTDLAGLILVDTRASADTPQGKQSRNAMIELARRQGSRAIADAMLPKLIAPGAPAASLLPILLDCPPSTICHALTALRDRADYTPLLPVLSMPVDVIVGELDAITPPAAAREMALLIPDARCTVIPGAGHLSPLEKPRAVSDAILAHLTHRRQSR